MRESGNIIIEMLLWPGEWLLATFPEFGPWLVSTLHLDSAADTVTVSAIASGAACLGVVALFALLRVVGRDVFRISEAFVRTFGFHLTERLRGFRTNMICRLRDDYPLEEQPVVAEEPEIRLNTLDEAILRTAAAMGPGFTVSAPELAERIAVRPSQIQGSLDRLRRNKMLDPVIGSTEGFGNYRLTDSGTFIAAMWQPQEPAASKPPARDRASF